MILCFAPPFFFLYPLISDLLGVDRPARLSSGREESNARVLSGQSKDTPEFVEADETKHQGRNNQAGGREQADDLEVAG